MTKARRRGGGENTISRDLFDGAFAAPLLASTARRRRECIAINYNDSTRYGVCDEAGYAPQGTKVVEDGPDAYFSTLPIRRIVRDLRANGVPADISGDAGTLMCNHLMYGVLHACSGRDIVAGWVHLPALPVRLGVLIWGRVDGVELHAVDAMCWSHTGNGGKR